jgi:hypothetical protein
MSEISKQLENPFILGGIIIVLYLAFQGFKSVIGLHKDVSAEIWQVFMTEPTKTTVLFTIGLLVFLFIIRGTKK